MSQTATRGLGIKRSSTAILRSTDEWGWRRIRPTHGGFAAVSELKSAELAGLPIILGDAEAQRLESIIQEDLATPRTSLIRIPTRD